MEDLRQYSDDELSLRVFNEEYFYCERNYDDKPDYVIALCREEFFFTDDQLEVLKQDLIDDQAEA